MDRVLDAALRAAHKWMTAGQPDRALREIKNAPASSRSAIAQLILAQACEGAGDLPAALGACSRAVKIAPKMAEAHYTQGLYLRRAQRPEEALAAYDRALRINPGLYQAVHNRGLVLLDLGRLEEALAAFETLSVKFPNLAEGHYGRGLLLYKLGRSGAAEAFRAAIRLDGRHAQAHFHLGLFAEAGGDREALTHYKRALSIEPNNPRFIEAEAKLLFRLQRWEQALDSLGRLSRIEALPFELVVLKGRCLLFLNRQAEAFEIFGKALLSTPDSVDAIVGKATVLKNRGQFVEAVALLETVPSERPDLIGLKAVLLRNMQRFDEALRYIRRGLEAFPDDVHLHYVYGTLLLAQGDFEHGWSEFERRPVGARIESGAAVRRDQPWPILAELSASDVVVEWEQGFGDNIQFARYLPDLARHCRSVEFRCGTTLHRLFRPFQADVRLVPPAVDDAQGRPSVLLMSLPRLLWTATAVIPAAPYLSAEPDLVKEWASRIGGLGFRIGISWQGRPNYAEDGLRSPPLQMFEPLVGVPDVRLISLQAHNGLDQLSSLSKDMKVELLGSDYDADPGNRFIDASAVIRNLDLIVTSDTAIAHLAGALGKPVFLALPQVPEWRWMDSGDTTPWYSKTRLFRQTSRGDWAGVFKAIASTATKMRQADIGEDGDYNPFFDRN